jgi:hypothetical protein
LFGYRTKETHLVLSVEPDQTYSLRQFATNRIPNTRVPMRGSLGCHLIGAALPVPDTTDPVSAVEGIVKRVAVKMPSINRAKMRRLRRFTIRFLNKHFKGCQFSADEDFNFYEWLDAAPYTQARKNVLKNKYEAESRNFERICRVEGFIKDEPYPEYKYPRGIYSRSDEYKNMVGPFFKKLGDKIFSNSYFIKKIPILERPQYIFDKLGSYTKVFCTDFSSFEATFGPELMKIEYMIYSWFLQYNPHKSELLHNILSGMMGTNVIQFRLFIFEILCRRMSGEMNTSVANGLMNLIMTFFLLQEAGNRDYEGVFEGDDSLVGHDKNVPTSQDYADLGANIKIDKPDSLSEASFCGIVCDSIDLNNVCDPVDALMSFSYCTRRYIKSSLFTKLSLLRAKSLSMLYQYAGCPILRSLALYGIRVSHNVMKQKLIKTFIRIADNTYERQLYLEIFSNYDSKFNELLNTTVGDRTRILVEKKYKIPVDVQIYVENYIDNLTILQPLELPCLFPFMHRDCFDYYSRYGIDISINNKTTFDFFTVSTGKKSKIWTNNQSFFYL